MAKCEECFSFRSCQAWCVVIDKLLQTNRTREELQKDDAESCPSFKNKADVVEVVRCKDCKHFQPYEGEEHKGDCAELVGLESCVYEDDFCSYGERKDNNDR